MLHSTPPTKILVPFANGGIKNTIPVASQIGSNPGAASFSDGFPLLTMTPLASGGIPPDGADFNGIFNAITAIQQWQSAGGLFPYDATLSAQIGGYPKGAMLAKADGSGYWISTVENNTSNPDAGGANWIDNNTSPTLPITNSSDANATTAFVANYVAAHGGGGGGPAPGSFAPLTNPTGGQNNYAPLASPAFSGNPTSATTPAVTAAGNSSLATTKYISDAFATVISTSDSPSPLPGKLTSANDVGGNAYNGWQMLPNRLIIQWGWKKLGVNPTNYSVYYGIAFPNVTLSVVAVSLVSPAIMYVTSGVNNSYFQIGATAPNGNAPGDVAISWIALGY